MDRGGWWATVYGVAKSQTQLPTCTYIHTHAHEIYVIFMENILMLANIDFSRIPEKPY